MQRDYYKHGKTVGFLPVRVLIPNIDDKLMNFSPKLTKIIENRIAKYNLAFKISCCKFGLLSEGHNRPYIIKTENSCEIRITEEYLSFLWIVSYAMLVIYDERMNKKARIMHLHEELTINDSLVDEAFVLFDVGMSMLDSYPGWSYDLPNPERYDDDNEYIEKNNATFEYAVLFILCHEIAHLNLGHIGLNKAKCLETEADGWALDTILEEIKDDNKTQYMVGILAALASTLFIDNKLTSNTHPDKDYRIKSLFEHDSINLDEKDNLWGLACLYFIFWERLSGNKIKDFANNTNYKIMFDHYLDKLEEYKA